MILNFTCGICGCCGRGRNKEWRRRRWSGSSGAIERVELIPDITAGIENPSTLLPLTAPWKVPYDAAQTPPAVLRRQIRRALRQTVERLKPRYGGFPRRILLGANRARIGSIVCGSVYGSEEQAHEGFLVGDVGGVEEAKARPRVHRGEEGAVRVAYHALVVPYNRLFQLGTLREQALRCVHHALSTQRVDHVSTAHE